MAGRGIALEQLVLPVSPLIGDAVIVDGEGVGVGVDHGLDFELRVDGDGERPVDADVLDDGERREDIDGIGLEVLALGDALGRRRSIH